MELVQKGQSAVLENEIKGAKFTLKWKTPIDLDIAAVIEKKDGNPEMVYFGDTGNLNEYPYIYHSGDQGVGGKVEKSGENEETMRIMKIDPTIAKIHLLGWNYKAIQKGEPGKFEDAGATMSLIDQNGTEYKVALTEGLGNVAVIATIDCTSPLGASIHNTSKTGVLKEMKNIQQLMDIITG